MYICGSIVLRYFLATGLERGDTEWPASLPDLSPLDYFFMEACENKSLRYSTGDSREVLSQNIVKKHKLITSEILHNVQ